MHECKQEIRVSFAWLVLVLAIKVIIIITSCKYYVVALHAVLATLACAVSADKGKRFKMEIKNTLWLEWMEREKEKVILVGGRNLQF